MIKLLNASYDNESGVSSVCIETELGNFYGYSFLHPEDKKTASSFLGCEIAEYRATIEYFKKRLYILNIEIKTLEELKHKEFCYSNIHTDMIEQKKRYKKELKSYIKELNEIISTKVKARIEVLKKLEKKHSDK